jgi:hypothetical protein
MELKKIADSENVWRRVFLNHIKRDGTLNSRAFKPRATDEGKLSVDVQSMTTYDQSIKNEEKHALYSLPVKFVHENCFDCYHNPIPDNKAHALIEGFEPDEDARAIVLAVKATKVFPINL